MKFEVRKRPQAERDIEECFVFIGEANLDVAVHFLVAVEETVEIIAENPFVGNLREFKDSKARNIRMILVKGFRSYRIFYKTDDNAIEIVRVLHGARDLRGIFD